MNSSVEQDLAELSKLTAENCANRGAAIVVAGEEACKFITLWLQYLRASHVTGTADCLLDGTSSAIREAIACVALGLVRPALNSLRLQIDLSLAWLYFKDHPVEWRRVQDAGEGFKLKMDTIKYLAESNVRYANRFGILLNIKRRKLDDPYRLLSAHIHGQSESVLPQVQMPKDIVGTPRAQDEVLELQHECSEYINDVFWSVLTDRWASVPPYLKTTLEARFKTPEQRAAFFS